MQALEKTIRAARAASRINTAHIAGEPGTGYEDGKLGEFECQNCYHFEDGTCNQAEMKKFSKQPRTRDGRVKVDPEGCCSYIEQIGRDDYDEGND